MKNKENTILVLAQALDPCLATPSLASFDTALIQTAMDEGVAGILFKSLMASGAFSSLDSWKKDTLQGFYYQTLRRNLRLLHELKRVLSHVNHRRLSVVVLQGMDLLNDPYEDIGLRPITDIDLWISKKELEPFERILETLGYERDAVYPGTFRRHSTLFDLHTHFLWADRIRARDFLLGKSEAFFLQELRPIEIEGQKALRLSSRDRILYLSLHALKHGISRLIWLVDIKRILERWNPSAWKSLLARAEHCGQKKNLLSMLFLLTLVFHFRVPSEILEYVQGQKLNALEKKILRQKARKGSLPLWGPVFLLSSELGPIKRGLFLFENLYPRTEILRQMFPSSCNQKPWQLYAKRTLGLFTMMKKSIFDLSSHETLGIGNKPRESNGNMEKKCIRFP